MIRAIQRVSMRLAQSYYQLARAIETGYTLGLPETSSDPEAVTMGGLREQYRKLLLEIADIDQPGQAPAADADERWMQEELANANGKITGTDEGRSISLADTDIDSYIQDWLSEAEANDDTKVKVDDFQWPETDLTLDDVRNAFADELKAAADSRAAQLEKIKKRDDLTPKQVFRLTEEVHNTAGSVAAGVVDAAGIDAGRQSIEYARKKDRRVLMVARGTGPNPCAFCAMLASRGFVYANAKTAGQIPASDVYGPDARGDINRYHDNCHCYPVTRWADIPDPTAPGRSAEYTALWEQMLKEGVDRRGTKNDALNDFRRRLNAIRRAERLKQLQTA